MSPVDALNQSITGMLDANFTLREGEQEFTKAFLEQALERNHGNVCKTARQLREHRNTISRKIKNLLPGQVGRKRPQKPMRV